MYNYGCYITRNHLPRLCVHSPVYVCYQENRVRYNQQYYKDVFNDPASIKALDESVTKPSLLRVIEVSRSIRVKQWIAYSDISRRSPVQFLVLGPPWDATVGRCNPENLGGHPVHGGLPLRVQVLHFTLAQSNNHWGEVMMLIRCLMISRNWWKRVIFWPGSFLQEWRGYTKN